MYPPVPLGAGPNDMPSLLTLTDQHYTGVRPKVKKPKPWPLFKYGTQADCMHEFQLKEKAYVRVFRNLIEIVFLKGVDSDTVAMIAFLICHVEANLYVNTPTEKDYKHLAWYLKKSERFQMLRSSSRATSTGIRPIS